MKKFLLPVVAGLAAGTAFQSAQAEQASFAGGSVGVIGGGVFTTFNKGTAKIGTGDEEIKATKGSGLFGGLSFGYAMPVSDCFLVGLGLDVLMVGGSSNGGDPTIGTASIKNQWAVHVPVQLGYRLPGHDKVLAYVEVGPAFSGVKWKYEPAGNPTRTGKKTSVGVLVGAGLKVKVTNELQMVAGYRYVRGSGKAKMTYADRNVSNVKIPASSHHLLLGLQYSF